MTEIQSMLQTCLMAQKRGLPYAVATVVKVEGSSYRTPGARMLVCSDGSRIGSISGGCLEMDVAEYARVAMETNGTRLVCYDGRSGFDLIMELGCKGSIHILVESGSPALCASLEFLASFERERGRGAIATVFSVKGETGVRMGDRMMQRGVERWHGNISDARIVTSLLVSLGKVQDVGRPLVQELELPDSGAEVKALIEPVKPPIALILFGAGQDAIPIAAMAGLMGWKVTVADDRASLLTPDRFPGVVAMLDKLTNESLALDDRTAAIIMSHSYSKDLEYLRRILPSSVGYIGLLGPRKRAEQMRNELLEEDIVLRNADLRRLHSPTGLDLGSETADGIALSVVAEIQAVMHDRSGGFLRERASGIHEPTSVEHDVECAGASHLSCMTLV